MMEEITSGVDELGVLLAGHKKNAYWYGSQLSVQEARQLAPHNSATSLQVTVAAPAGEGGQAEGGCLCGAIRYRVPMPPLWVAHCHCSMCRRAQGAGFVTWFGVPGDRFSFVGSGDRLRIYRSSADATRSFCGRCGTPLFFESKHWPGELHVTLASLDPAAAATLQPQMHAYWSSRVPWVSLGDELPRKDPPDHG